MKGQVLLPPGVQGGSAHLPKHDSMTTITGCYLGGGGGSHLQRLLATVQLVLHLIGNTQLVKTCSKGRRDHLQGRVVGVGGVLVVLNGEECKAKQQSQTCSSWGCFPGRSFQSQPDLEGQAQPQKHIANPHRFIYPQSRAVLCLFKLWWFSEPLQAPWQAPWQHFKAHSTLP
jgi:hypothetical protein